MRSLRSPRLLALALGVVLAVVLLGPSAGAIAAASAAAPAHTPTPTPIPTSTPYPTYTAVATYTPAPTQTRYPSPTVPPSPSPSPSPIPQGTDPHNPTHYCTGLLNWCPDLSGLFNAVGGVINGLIVAVFSPLEHAFSDSFTRLVAPFQKDLTYTPDIPHEASWGGLRNLQTSLQELAATLFFGFLLVGVFARYLEQLGHGDFAQLTSPLRRGVVVTGLIAGYPTVMTWGLTVVNSAASVINGIPLDAHETAWEAVRGAMFTLGNAFSFQGVLDVLVMLVAYALVILSVVVRDFGLGTLGALYIVGPLCLACFVSPYLEVIARAWVKMVMSLSLWPIGYSLVLKVITLMFAGGGPLSEFGGFSAALGALGLVLLLYKTPAVVGSFVGSTGAVLGAVASSVTDAGLGSAVGAARSFLGSKGFPGAGH
jgi:hypothetical protein